MRLVNILAALSGLIAFGMLAFAAHALRETLDAEALDRIKLAAFVQIGAAASGLALANRANRLNMIAASMILGGAAIFSGTLYAISLTGSMAFVMLAPIGGITLLLGWVLLVFANPGA